VQVEGLTESVELHGRQPHLAGAATSRRDQAVAAGDLSKKITVD